MGEGGKRRLWVVVVGGGGRIGREVAKEIYFICIMQGSLGKGREGEELKLVG